jgi:magnesium transporter
MMTLVVAADRFDTEVLQQHWIPISKSDAETATVLRERLGVDFAAAGSGIWEAKGFLYLPVAVSFQRGESTERATIVFALGAEFLVTLQPNGHFTLFDKAIAKMEANPRLIGSSHGVMYALLWALNQVSEHVLLRASDALEAMNEEVERVIGGGRAPGEEVGVADIRKVMSRMNAIEEVVSRIRETQLQLARAARHLQADSPNHLEGLESQVTVLIADVDAVKEHAGFEHDKLRYLQQSMMTRLGVKQNRIVKVFTIIAAVFLPPTLIATSYGMNVTWMPELEWEVGLLAIPMMLVAAVIPLVYIKRKGWLR